MPAVLPGAEIVGDPLRTKWCAMISTEPVGKYGSENYARRDFDACGLFVLSEDYENSFEVRVGAGQKPGSATSGDRDAGHGLTVATVKSTKTECVQHVVFDDGVRIAVEAEVMIGSFAVSMCEPMKAMTEHVVGYLLAGKRPGSVDAGAGTLRDADACALGAAAVEKSARFQSARHVPEADDPCRWALPRTGETLYVEFGVEQDFGQDGGVATVAGRDTVTDTSVEPSQCHLYGKHREESPGVHEVVRITVVNDAEEPYTLCAEAKEFAAVLFPMLPPAA
ncbi:hypothetical protein Actkin_01865 [Actinokineospora sp. UTMC 2448]|nr:hypothetical protein Actkin_01865 [Actinokineospora sp. UTMC 2448]